MKKKRKQYYWDIVNEGDLYEERLSITLFSCIELEYLCYDKGLSARHYDDQNESDDHDHDHDTRGSVVEEEVKEERQWDALISTEKEEEEFKEERQWDALPSTALLNIFCKSELKDRLQSIPLVCKSWKCVTDDPRCWSSMIPDSISPEDAFIKRYYEFPFYHHNTRKLVEKVPDGLTRLRILIKKSGGGAAITSLYLSPFTYCWDREEENYYEEENDDEVVIRLITDCCPNLKHISFHRYFQPSTEALIRLFNRCKKLELMDLSFFNIYDDDPSVIQRLLCCLPNLRGFRIFTYERYHIAVAIAVYLPQLSLLSYGSRSLTSEGLSTILCNCLELQYLHVMGDQDMRYYGPDILDQASAQIPEFYYETIYEPPETPPPSSHGDWQMSTEDELNCFEDDHEEPNETDYFFIDDYDDILKQRKEKKEYHYMFEF